MLYPRVLAAALVALAISAPVVRAHDTMHMKHGEQGMAMPAEGIMIDAAWTPQTPPGAASAAVYLTLTNRSGNAIAVIGAGSPVFGMGHVHRTSTSDGIASMQAVEHLAIPAGKSAVFEPGGLHIMLMSPARAFSAGETIPVTLYFEDDTSTEFEAMVVKSTDGAHSCATDKKLKAGS